MPPDPIHNPAPWAEDGEGSLRGADNERIVVSALHVASGHKQSFPRGPANTAFILAAVNQHDAMRSALLALDALLGGDSVRAETIYEARSIIDKGLGRHPDPAAETAATIARAIEEDWR